MPRARTVLCVDEYQALLDTMAPVLQPFGFEVWTASSLEQAYELTAAHQPDAVLLEYRMCPACPARGGACLAGQIHALSPATKILVWCADGRAMQELPPCAHAVFMKPLAPADLADHLDEVLDPTSPVSRNPSPAQR